MKTDKKKRKKPRMTKNNRRPHRRRNHQKRQHLTPWKWTSCPHWKMNRTTHSRVPLKNDFLGKRQQAPGLAITSKVTMFENGFIVVKIIRNCFPVMYQLLLLASNSTNTDDVCIFSNRKVLQCNVLFKCYDVMYYLSTTV